MNDNSTEQASREDAVVLVVGTQQFRGSMSLLTTASPVFEAMLGRSGMQEAREYVFDVRECDADVFFLDLPRLDTQKTALGAPNAHHVRAFAPSGRPVPSEGDFQPVRRIYSVDGAVPFP